MTINLPTISKALVRANFLVFTFVLLLVFFSKLNPAQAINLSGGEGDPWGCHNGCEITIEGNIAADDGTPVNGVQIHTRGGSSWWMDGQLYENQINEHIVTSGVDPDSGEAIADGHWVSKVYNPVTYDVWIESVPNGYKMPGRTNNDTVSHNYCTGGQTPLNSSAYNCQTQDQQDDGSRPRNSCDQIRACNFYVDHDPVGGYIKDQNGTGVGNISVDVCTGSNCSSVTTVTTGSDGHFQAWNVLPGHGYAVRNPRGAGYSSFQTTTVGDTWMQWICGIASNVPAGSASYECQDFGLNDCATAQTSHGAEACNFTAIRAVPPTPSVSTNFPRCIPNPYSGNDITISWAGTTPAVTYVDVSSDSNFGSWANKTIGGGATSTTAIGGFLFNGSPATLVPNTRYYVRAWNGYNHSASTSFVTPDGEEGCSVNLNLTLSPSLNGQNGSFSGAPGVSGRKSAGGGSNWNNNFVLTLVGSQPSLMGKYYVAFYDKSLGGKVCAGQSTQSGGNGTGCSGFKGLIEQRLGNNPQNGFITWYDANARAATIMNTNGRELSYGDDSSVVVNDNNGNWVYTITPSITQSTSARAVWDVQLSPNMASKDMWVAIYAISQDGTVAAFQDDVCLANCNTSTASLDLKFRSVLQ